MPMKDRAARLPDDAISELRKESCPLDHEGVLKVKHDLPPLWRCPKCGERFVTENMWHSCGKFTIEDLFARSEPHVIQLFHRFAEMIRKCGPVTMIPQKTRVVFQVRVRFGGCQPRKSHLLCGLALPRADDDPRFFKIEKYAAHFIGHSFRVHTEADLDQDVQRWMCESYEVGAQKHLKR